MAVLKELNDVNGVHVTAPLFRDAPVEDLLRIINCLSNASFHYADDSGGECGIAGKEMRQAGHLVNQHRLGFYAIERLYKHQPVLPPMSEFVDAVIKAAREEVSK